MTRSTMFPLAHCCPAFHVAVEWGVVSPVNPWEKNFCIIVCAGSWVEATSNVLHSPMTRHQEAYADALRP